MEYEESERTNAAPTNPADGSPADRPPYSSIQEELLTVRCLTDRLYGLMAIHARAKQRAWRLGQPLPQRPSAVDELLAKLGRIK